MKAVMRGSMMAMTLAGVLALGACAPSGLVLRLVPHAPDSAALAHSTANLPSGAWPAPDWIKGLGDPQLTALVEQALHDNPGVQVAEARIRVAQSQLQQYASTGGVNATFGGSFDKTHLPESNGIAEVQTAGRTLPVELSTSPALSSSSLYTGLSYDLDLWGKRRTVTDSLLSQRDAARLDAEEARLTLSVALASLYSQLDTSYKLQDILEAKRAASEQIDAVLRERMARGLDNAYDASDAALKREKLEQMITLNETSRELVELQIGSLTGQGPEAGLKLGRPHLAELPAQGVPPNLPVDLIGRRPDILAARLRVEAAYDDVEGARKEFYPDINLSAVGGLFALTPGGLWTHKALGGSIGPAFSLPIFSRGRLKANLAGKAAGADVTIGLYNSTLDAALTQVAQQLTTLRTVDRLITDQRTAVQEAQHMVSILDERHRRGIVMEKDVNTARLTWFDEQTQLINLSATQRMLRVSLIGALGGGFDAHTMQDGGPPLKPSTLKPTVFLFSSQSRLTDSVPTDVRSK
jgi:NodT family efflux transporter outer membrane factor (OMF) lipoprotein